MVAEKDDYRGWGPASKPSRKPAEFGAHGRGIRASFGFVQGEIEALAESGVLVETRRR